MTPVRLEPAALRSRVKHSTTEPLRSRVPSQYLLHGQVLESVAGSKYLGVEISNNLSFNSHIQNITSKRNIRSKNPVLREMAHKTLVRPLREYSSSVWSPYTKSNIDRLEMVQRRAATWSELLVNTPHMQG